MTITTKSEAESRLVPLLKMPNYRFVSLEPLCSDMAGVDFSGVDQIIVGGMTGMGNRTVIPKREWIESVNHPNIFLKQNIKPYLN